jgi:hypothetical protein
MFVKPGCHLRKYTDIYSLARALGMLAFKLGIFQTFSLRVNMRSFRRLFMQVASRLKCKKAFVDVTPAS